MAGGPTTPQSVEQAWYAGSFSALAWGTCDIVEARAQLDAMPADATFGINLFCPQDPLTDAQLATAREFAAAEGVELGEPDYTFGWHEKLDLALSGRGVAVVWSMFGTFSAAELERIHAAGLEAWTTVTCPEEALAAARLGVDVLCVQGPEAGGHRGVWDVQAAPDARPLPELVAAVHAALSDASLARPLIAAGGIRTAAEVREALRWPGVAKVSCGSSFLLAEEAGTSAANRALLAQAPKTASTRAFSGRFARGAVTPFTQAHPDLPPLYPFLNQILGQRRRAGDPEVAYCLAGIRTSELDGGKLRDILAQMCK